MKRVIAILVVAVSLLAFTEVKTFTLKFSEQDLTKHYNKLETVKQIVGESNLPHQQVVFIQKSIDSLQTEILAQVQAQVDTTKKK